MKAKETVKKTRRTARRGAVIGLAAACAAALILLVALLAMPAPAPERGEFTPPPFDASAQAGRPEVDESMGWSELTVRAGYSVRVCGELDADGEGRVPVWFYSDGDNQVWVKLRMLDGEGNILGETGILRPGEYTQVITLDKAPERTCPVTLLVMGYEPETYYSAGSVSLSTTLRMP